MSFIAKSPLILPEIKHTPSTPQGTRGLFAKDGGWYDIDVDGNIKKIGVTSYNDLADKPVQYIFDFENLDETLDNLTEPGIYCIQSKVEDDFTSDTYQTQYYVFVTINEGECLPVEDGDRQYKETKYSQLIVTDFMVKRREKIKRLYRDDNTEEVTEWEFVPLNDDLATKEYVNEKIKNISPGGGGGVTSYNDLTDKPITILSAYPTEKILNSLGMGMFYWKSDYFTDGVLIISSDNEDWLVTDDGVGYKQQRWTQIIISESGIRKRQKINNRGYDDNRPETTIDWQYVPIDDDLATKEYVDSAIGDIETSLENIIAKYGLGGDEV